MTPEEYKNELKEIYALHSKENTDDLATILELMDSKHEATANLTKAVIKQMGLKKGDTRDLLEACNQLKYDAGFDCCPKGFLLHTAKTNFFNDNRDDIINLINYEAEALGYANDLEFINEIKLPSSDDNIKFTINDIIQSSKKKSNEYEDFSLNIPDEKRDVNYDNSNAYEFKLKAVNFSLCYIVNSYARFKEEFSKDGKDINREYINKALTMIHNRIKKEKDALIKRNKKELGIDKYNNSRSR